MTIRELRDCLFEVREQDQEISIDDICSLIGLWERYKGIDNKIDQLIDEKINYTFIKGWQKEKAETLNLVRNYSAK